MDTDHRLESVDSLYAFAAACSEKSGSPKIGGRGATLAPALDVVTVPVLTQKEIHLRPTTYTPHPTIL